MLLPFVMIAALATAPADFAFLAPEEGVWQVYLSTAGEEPRVVTHDARDKVYLSAASRSGEMLAVTLDGDGILLDSAGQVVKTVAFGAGVDQAALSPDGTQIAFSRAEGRAGALRRGIWLMDRSTGDTRPLVRRAGFQRAPAWSADGSAIAYTASSPDGGEDVWWIALDGSVEKQLTVGGKLHFEPSVAPDGAVFISSNRGDEGYDIWRIDPQDGSLEAVVAERGLQGQPSVSNDGEQLLWVSGAPDSAVWTARIDGTAARPLTGKLASVRYPVWLPDFHAAGWIAFLRVTDGLWQPWVVRPDGTELRRIATLPVDTSRLTVSRDGSKVLANCNDGTLHLIDPDDGSSRQTEPYPAGSTDAAISPDGERIVYSVNTLGSIDSNDLWVVGREGGAAKRITEQPYLQHFPVWASDREILYLSGRGGQVHDIWRVDRESRTTESVLEQHLYNFEPSASESGDIAFSSNHAGNYDVWLLEAGADEPRALTKHPAYDGQPSLSPDGKHVVFISRRAGTAQLWVMELASGMVRNLHAAGQARLPFWYAGSERTESAMKERLR